MLKIGHTPDGGITGSADEVFNRVKHPRNIAKFFRKVWQQKLDGTDLRLENIEEIITKPYYPQNVVNIDLNNLKDVQETNIISLGFENLTSHSVKKLELRLLDSNIIANRPLVSMGQFNGDLIEFDSKSDNVNNFEYHFTVVMQQTKFLEEDNNCIAYPTKEFKDYRSCDDSFQREYLKALIPNKSYWAFGAAINEEANGILVNESVMTGVYNLFIGAARSDCLLPCTTTVAKTEYIFEKESGYDSSMNWISFYLPEKVRLTSTVLKDTSVSQVHVSQREKNTNDFFRFFLNLAALLVFGLVLECFSCFRASST